MNASLQILSLLFIILVVFIITITMILIFDFFPLTSLPIQADTKPTKPAIKSSTLPRTSSQGKLFDVHYSTTTGLTFIPSQLMSSRRCFSFISMTFATTGRAWPQSFILTECCIRSLGIASFCLQLFHRALGRRKHVEGLMGFFPIAERDRLKPAPPPKPAGLSGQQMALAPQRSYTIHITADFFQQFRVLQKQSRDLRIEVSNYRSTICNKISANFYCLANFAKSESI